MEACACEKKNCDLLRKPIISILCFRLFCYDYDYDYDKPDRVINEYSQTLNFATLSVRLSDELIAGET